jgi:hypothetical protein
VAQACRPGSRRITCYRSSGMPLGRHPPRRGGGAQVPVDGLTRRNSVTLELGLWRSRGWLRRWGRTPFRSRPPARHLSTQVPTKALPEDYVICGSQDCTVQPIPWLLPVW